MGLFLKSRNGEYLTNSEGPQRDKSSTTHLICDYAGGDIFLSDKKSFFFLIIFLKLYSFPMRENTSTDEVPGEKLQPRRAKCTEIRLFAILPPPQGMRQPFSN